MFKFFLIVLLVVMRLLLPTDKLPTDISFLDNYLETIKESVFPANNTDQKEVSGIGPINNLDSDITIVEGEGILVLSDDYDVSD